MPSCWHAYGTKDSSQQDAKSAVTLQLHNKCYHLSNAKHPSQWQKGHVTLLIVELKGVLYHIASALHA